MCATQNYGAFCNQKKAKTSFIFRLLVFVAAFAFSPPPFPFPFFAILNGPCGWVSECASVSVNCVCVCMWESVPNEPFQCSMLTHLHILIKKFRVRPRDRHQLAEQGLKSNKKEKKKTRAGQKGSEGLGQNGRGTRGGVTPDLVIFSQSRQCWSKISVLLQHNLFTLLFWFLATTFWYPVIFSRNELILLLYFEGYECRFSSHEKLYPLTF